MQNKIDFEQIASRLLRDASRLLPQWLPGGKTVGREYCCGNLRGEPGNSLKVNLETGRWADFADGEKGGDLISLYAAINGCKQIDAAKVLSDSIVAKNETHANDEKPLRPKKSGQGLDLIVPPKGTRLPKFYIPQLGEPVARWTYKTPNGSVLFFVTRYNLADGKKEFRPWSFSSDGRWVKRYPERPRPLYNLDQLTARAGAPVLIVEGEKSADAAHDLLGKYYVTTTWPNGGNAWAMADWSPLYGRTILIWPDSDQPGIDAADAIAHHLHENGCSVKILNVVANGGWDVADARDEGYDTDRAIAWAKERASVFTPRVVPVEVVPVGHHLEPVPVPPEPPHEHPPEQHIHIYQDADQVPTSLASSFNELWVRSGLTLSGNGQPVINADNAARMILFSKKYGGKIWYDALYQSIYTSIDGAPRQWRDIDTIRLMIFLQGECGLSRMTDHATFSAVQLIADNDVRDSARDWLTGLVWDNEPRIDHFLHVYCGAENTEYTLTVSRNLFLSVVARIMLPGCKVDTMPILEGRQGSRKSTMLQVLGGQWYAESNASMESKDFYQQLRGKIIVEFAELDLFRRSDVNTIKRVLSTAVDEYRPPYGRAVAEFPRRCVFVGTTNQDEYLKDETGNRRFWPVMTTKLDIDAAIRDRDQLFAEAFVRFKGGENWWTVPIEESVVEQASRVETDPWEEIISEYIHRTPGTRNSGVLVKNILLDCLKFDESRITYGDARRVGKCLRVLGYQSKTERAGSRTNKVFRRTEQLSL